MLSYLTQLVAEYLPSTDSPTHTDSALKKRFAPYTKPEASEKRGQRERRGRERLKPYESLIDFGTTVENESQSAIPNNNDGQASSTQTSGIHEDNMPVTNSLATENIMPLLINLGHKSSTNQATLS